MDELNMKLSAVQSVGAADRGGGGVTHTHTRTHAREYRGSAPLQMYMKRPLSQLGTQTGDRRWGQGAMCSTQLPLAWGRGEEGENESCKRQSPAPGVRVKLTKCVQRLRGRGNGPDLKIKIRIRIGFGSDDQKPESSSRVISACCSRPRFLLRDAAGWPVGASQQPQQPARDAAALLPCDLPAPRPRMHVRCGGPVYLPWDS